MTYVDELRKMARQPAGMVNVRSSHSMSTTLRSMTTPMTTSAMWEAYCGIAVDCAVPQR